MIDALYVGTTGLAAQQIRLETVANNLANMNTPAFKRSHPVLLDLMSRESATSGIAPSTKTPPRYIGLGTRVAGVEKVFTQGELRATDSAFDLAINGDGLIGVLRTDGSIVFSRGGSLRVNEEGLLALYNGMPLDPPIAVPQDAQHLSIDTQGRVHVALAQGEPMEIGQINLALFNAPGGLTPLGENLYAAAEASGEPQFEPPGEGGRGVLLQKHLEGANVKMADELVNMMLALRAFEANSKIIQAADEMWAMSNHLRRA